MITDRLLPSIADFEAGTGWTLKPEGACRGDVCVPLPTAAVDRSADTVDVDVVGARLGMPIVRDDERGLLAIGPATLSGKVLATADAPELTLPDVDGRPFRLSSLRGQKVALVAWAPY